MAENVQVGPMQESWVEVQDQQQHGGGGTLTHTSSKEEMKQLLASAASEEELSDSDQVVYKVTFTTTDEAEDLASPGSTEGPKLPRVPIPPHIPSADPIPVVSMTESSSRGFGNGICSLTLLFPVIILTHLAVFGIGYYLGRRWSGDPAGTVTRLFHV